MNMKPYNIIFFLLAIFPCSYVSSAHKNSSPPTEEQVQKLAAAAWQEPIKSIDVKFYKEYSKPPEPVEQIRKRAEEFADRIALSGRPLDELESYEVEERNRIIEANLKNWVENQKHPRKAISRVRIAGDKQRIDLVYIEPNELLEPNIPFTHTFINTKDPNTGEFVSYHYAHDINTVFIDTKKWAEENIIQFGRIPISSSLQAFLGLSQENISGTPSYKPDFDKMQELTRTGFATIKSIRGVKLKRPELVRIKIKPTQNAPDARDTIEIGEPNQSPSFILECNREDYSCIYRMESRNPTTGQITYIRESEDFNSKGFPYNITEIQYDRNGKLEEYSVYKIIKVELSPLIPANVFEFDPPENYKVTDYR